MKFRAGLFGLFELIFVLDTIQCCCNDSMNSIDPIFKHGRIGRQDDVGATEEG